MVGISGVGGIGKTAIARALYDEISCQLRVLVFLQILGGESREIRPFHRRNNLMKDKIRCKKVLIILDDVNDMKQLQILAGKHDWFGKGSRIVITTRNKRLLHQHEVDEFYEPKGLDPREALELFSHHANTNEESLNYFYPLSKQIINYCDHHPLALQVVGSFLRGKSYLHWQVQLENLARESARENLNILRVSYNGLSRQEQYIFLDVACFFKGEHKDFVTKILDGHDLSAEDGVKVLADRQTLPLMGSYGYPTPIEDEKVEGISLDLSKSNQIHFSTEVFARMTELKLLKVSPLAWIPTRILSFNFEAMELLELNMPYSCLKQINGNESLPTLGKYLKLLEDAKFGETGSEGCRSLVSVDPSIGDLNKLSLMNLKDCKRLNSLPKSIFKLKFLETLILAGCTRLEKLLDDLEGWQRIITLPPKLRILRMGHCKRFQEILKLLPPSIQEVDAYNCISMGTLSWKTELGESILHRIEIPKSEFSILLPGNRIPDCCFTHKETGSSVTMELKNPDWYNDDFLGFALCLVFAPQAERPQLNPEILCELNNFTFFYYCGEDSVDEFAESDQEWGNNSTHHVWLAYQPRARADRCHPKEWNHIKASLTCLPVR
ncbi:Disease resistance-like protein DSC1 [Vitis vinifera]|uniref:ADP-ribosyl cyclase/cyclic ADP-ribose hydrolase n=1 Tax=Vitis vinifera TaxID=29760 RepID=A0A438FVU9_VITVI|nr:Disease resistance-like protein DSC1 [Vitis vinifera]